MADFAELKRKLGERRGYDGNDTRLGSWINDARAEIFGMRQDWSWTQGEWQFLTRPPETGSAVATYTLDSNVVTLLTAATVSRTGAWITTPGGALSQVAAGHSNGTSAYMSTVFPDATTTLNDYKVYFLDYPMPAGMRGILSVVATGSGRTYPISERSIQVHEMALRTQRDYEAGPANYSVMKHSRLPTTRLAATASLGAGGGLSAGVYKWWWCWRNTATGELGPLSPVSADYLATATQAATVTMGTKWDLGRRVFRSLVGGSEPYFLADVAATGTYVDSRTDDELGFDGTTEADHGRHTEAGGHHLVRLWPPPDDRYLVTVVYYRAFQKLVEDNDAPWIPVEWHPAILRLAEAYALGEDEQHSAAARARAEAMAMVARMETAEDVDPASWGAMGGRLGARRGRADFGLGEGAWPHLVGQ